jgi:hypothetical protein
MAGTNLLAMMQGQPGTNAAPAAGGPPALQSGQQDPEQAMKLKQLIAMIMALGQQGGTNAAPRPAGGTPAPLPATNAPAGGAMPISLMNMVR